LEWYYKPRSEGEHLLFEAGPSPRFESLRLQQNSNRCRKKPVKVFYGVFILDSTNIFFLDQLPLAEELV